MTFKREPGTTFGIKIPNTDLVRRYHGETELAPVYVGARPVSDVQHLDRAFSQAAAAGYCAVLIDEHTYVRYRGVWYLFDQVPCAEKRV